MLDDFVTACRRAAASPQPVPQVRALLSDLVAYPARLAEEIAVPDPAGAGTCGTDDTLFEDDDVTIIVVHSRPGMVQPPHDHSMAAVIGVYEGAESQRFFRLDQSTQSTLVETPGRTIETGEVLALGQTTIHAISAGDTWARAVHVYLGRLSTVERSLFDPVTGQAEPMTVDRYDELAVATN